MFGFPQMLYNLNYTKQLLFENYIHLLRQQLMIVLIIELSIDYFQEFKSVIVVVVKNNSQFFSLIDCFFCPTYSPKLKRYSIKYTKVCSITSLT